MELHKKIHMYPMDTFDSIDKKKLIRVRIL